MDEIIDTETAKWLLARFPRPLVVAIVALKALLINPPMLSIYFLVALAAIVYFFKVWGIVFIISSVILIIFAIAYSSIDEELPKREKKQDKNQT